jgi:hypothetical protein
VLQFLVAPAQRPPPPEHRWFTRGVAERHGWR